MEIAKQNGYSTQYIKSMIKKHSIKKRRKNANNALDQPTETKKKWVTFGYYSPLVRKVTNLFKNTQVRIAFKLVNTIQQLLTNKRYNQNTSGIYENI